ncbi:S41 family peptidase [Prevotella sp. 10(H)]|uniref:S41 family peptidase n=1 Tax=Prevotella sp. 10(H) TaxID=1158294 RepID=UPI0004A6F2A2|nr:S41 family peptidase [Prevotella sp. 10(H)]
MRKYYCLLFLSAFLVLFSSTVPAQKKLSRQQLVSDADILYVHMYDIHPDLFAEFAKEDFEKDLAEIKLQFTDSMTFVDFFRLVTPLVVKLNDGHTRIYPPANLLEEDRIQFPLFVDINKNGKTFSLKNDYSDAAWTVPAGTEILSVNGHKSRDMYDKFLTYISGEKVEFKQEMMKYLFNALPYFIYGDSVFSVSYMDESKKAKSVTLKGMSSADLEESRKQYQEQKYPDYSFSIDKPDNVAIIDFRSFVNLERFKVFLDSVFTVIKKENLNNLIIDIRNNGGGNSALGDELFQYISPVPFTQYGNVTVKISPTLKRLWNDKESPIGLETYSNTEESLIKLRENNLRYNGNIYLLTSSMTFSSAADFAWAFQYFKMGTVVGEETGGLVVSFGDVVGTKLPSTNMSYGVSFKKFYGYGADDSNRHGVIPEHKVAADNAMDYALELINKIDISNL